MIAGSELVLIVATLLNAAMWATLGGIGITVAQDLYPSGIGLASSLYFSAIRFAAAIGGIAGALGVGWFGVPGVFVVPAALCLLAAVGLLVQEVARGSDRSQPTALRTRARSFFSTASVTCSTANDVAHISPSSSAASSLKPIEP